MATTVILVIISLAAMVSAATDCPERGKDNSYIAIKLLQYTLIRDWICINPFTRIIFTSQLCRRDKSYCYQSSTKNI